MRPFSFQILHELSLSEQTSVIAPGQEQTLVILLTLSKSPLLSIMDTYLFDGGTFNLFSSNKYFSNVPSLPGILFLGILVNETGKYHPFRELAFS